MSTLVHSVEGDGTLPDAAIEALRVLVALKRQQWAASAGTTTAPPMPKLTAFMAAWDAAFTALHELDLSIAAADHQEPAAPK